MSKALKRTAIVSGERAAAVQAYGRSGLKGSLRDLSAQVAVLASALRANGASTLDALAVATGDVLGRVNGSPFAWSAWASAREELHPDVGLEDDVPVSPYDGRYLEFEGIDLKEGALVARRALWLFDASVSMIEAEAFG